MPKPITNCHTHIFTSDHVPPFIGKTFLPFGLAYVLTIPFVVKLFRAWFYGPYKWQFQPWYKTLVTVYYKTKIFITRNIILNIISTAAGIFICIQVFFILYDWFSYFFQPEVSNQKTQLMELREWLTSRNILLASERPGIKILLIIIVMLFIKSGRNLIFFLLKRFFSFFTILPGKQTQEYLKRYLNIGRFAFYKSQKDIFQKLKAQYPKNTRFMVLPMDMEFMDAGKPKADFYKQMNELADIKGKNQDTILPFLFIDPRRIKEDPNFFKYSFNSTLNKIELQDCMVKNYIVDKGFHGFKIYPALGYYPFDKDLLPLWKYAAQEKLPIMTHCIRGTIFYRGPKKKEWDEHPVFMQANNNGSFNHLLLPQTKNADFSTNFTHPLNYICLLKEFLLRTLVGSTGDKNIQAIFGYVDNQTPLTSDLNDLKLCFGHFGGDDEWDRYFETDRDNYSPQILHEPFGIDFLNNAAGAFSWDKLEQLWKGTDWYSIICSIMLQHPNVFSDISYIIHNPSIWPLLKDTLDRDPVPGGSRSLSDGILFGTDFYVVRNHKSDKQLLAELKYNLSDSHVDLITNINPSRF